MKIDFTSAFKVLNEIYLVRKMTIAERILIRQKKDLINYVAIHFWSIIKTVFVLSVLFLLTRFPNQVPIGLFWIYFFTGAFFLIVDKLGIKVLVFFFRKFFLSLYKMIVNSYISIKDFFIKLGILSFGYGVALKVLFWILVVILSPILLVLYFAIFVLVVGLYVLIFLLLIFNGNEALSLLILNSIGRLLPLDITILRYVFYGISVLIIYFLIDYRIWMTEGTLINKKTETDGHNKVVGLKLLNSNNMISIYSKNADFYVLNNNTDILTVFEVQNRLKFIEKETIDWFKKKNQNIDNIESGENNE